MKDFQKTVKRCCASPGEVWQEYRFSAIVLAAVLVLVLFVYHVFSDGDFSFLMVRVPRLSPGSG